MMAAPLEDCWDAFGSDDDEDDQGEQISPHGQVVLWLAQHFLRWNPQIPLSQRRVYCPDNEHALLGAFKTRGIHLVPTTTEFMDAALLAASDSEETSRLARLNIVPNGVVIMVDGCSCQMDTRVWSPAETVSDGTTAAIKHSCPINQDSCPWMPSSHSLVREQTLVRQATVTRSAHELSTCTLKLTEHDVQRATTCLQKYGYCLVRNLVNPTQCLQWGEAVLSDLKEASQILQERFQIAIKSPGVDTTNYRELAMREDLRMDLRDGPHLRKLRSEEYRHYSRWGIDPAANNLSANDALSATPIITTSNGSLDSCLRFHPDVLEITRRTMNPQNSFLYKGNFGRYNFDGSGPDGSFQPLRVGPMGGIVSLPGAADQAIHADTPHLFEHVDCLPAHYINAFCLGADIVVESDADGSRTGSTPVGGTAFVHESHRLSFCAEMETQEKEQLWKHLVRPSLQVGDVVLFDCRVLHFGLANNSKDVERPLLYTNMTHAWFHDPKNWNDRQQIFDL